MHTSIHVNLRNQEAVQEACEILRNCVHCGFCNAVCPTYQLLGDELDGPRGRISIIKNLLAEDTISSQSASHIDRCLTCRSCESTCPSGVKYGRLLDIGREIINDHYTRPFHHRFLSWNLRKTLSRPQLFRILLSTARIFRHLLPRIVAQKVPAKEAVSFEPQPLDVDRASQRIMLLNGCVQQAATPNVNAAIEYLLTKRNVEVTYLESEGCCGALDYHLSAYKGALGKIKDLVDKLDAKLSSVDYIVSAASGCGVTIKEYPEILKYDKHYYEKSKRIASKVLDVSEYLSRFNFRCQNLRIAVHTPCSLGHGQKMPTHLEKTLEAAGATLVEVGDKHICCGSAGSYSILQPGIADELTSRKIRQLERAEPDYILTANIGCQLQLNASADIPVMHWVEFLALKLLND